MPVSNWIFPGGGSWNAFDNWSAGVAGIANPDARIGLVSASPGTIPVTISIANGTTLRLRSLEISLTGGVSLNLAGVGTNPDWMDFVNPGDAASLTFSGDRNFTISSTGTLGIRLLTDTRFINTELISGGAIILDAPISGSGAFIKEGPGLLVLGNSNSFTGGLSLQGGVLEYAFGDSVGTGNIDISNDGTLTSRNTAIVSNAIGTLADATGTLGAATISAAAGTTLTLTGVLSHLSRGELSFGQLGDTGTIVADFSQIIDNAVDSSFSVDYYTLRFGDAYNAANLFDRVGTGRTTINGILDTAGFATRISNLFLTNGEIRSSSGALDVIVNNIANVVGQSGTVFGTASADQFLVLTQGDVSLAGMNFSGWSGADIIEIYGNGGANALTGSTAGDAIFGFAGNDILTGNGGVDSIYGDINNDLIVLNALNAGSFVDGGSGTDTLRLVGGGQYGLGAFSGFEAVELQNNSVLILTAAQFATGLSANANVSGDGAIQVELSLGNQSMIATGMTATGGGFTFAVNGSSGADVVRVAPNSASAIEGFAGNDQLEGSNVADYIDAGDGDDVLLGGGGGDALIGGNGFDTASYVTSSTAVSINLAANSFIGGDAAGDNLTSIERIIGSAFADSLTGSASSDTLEGGGGNDIFNLANGGTDTVRGGADNDVVGLGATLTAADSIDGGTGTDQVGLSGNYVLTLGASTLTNVEVLALLPGVGNTYAIATNNANVAAGVEMTIFAGNLGTSQNFTFNGGAETDGFFRTFGGLGRDIITGGALSDGFYFGPGKWQAGDSVVGGGGTNDQLALDGDYSITIGASADVEVLVLLAGPSGTPNNFNITLDDVWTATGATKTVFGRQNILGMTINGSAEANGNFIFFGGFGNDTLTSGGGSDQIYGLEGNDTITGGLGSDTAVYQGLRASYSVVTGGGSVQIVDNDAVTDGNDGTDGIVGIEFARFADQTISITSPIILDLDGGGVETLSASQSNAAYDMDGDGIGDDTSWFGGGEGLLFLDRDGNGTLSNAGEMSFTNDVANARSDLEGLAAFDSNGDGQLSKQDKRFASFKIWRDRNGDGVVDRGEVMSLRNAGVRSLSLSGTANNGSYALGDTAIVNTGSFTRTNGRQGGLIDAVLTAVSSRATTDQSSAAAMLSADDPLTAMRDSMAAVDASAPDITSFDPRVAMMAQDMASFGGDRDFGVNEMDRRHRYSATPAEFFAA